MIEREKLTNRQADALKFIKNFVNKNGYPPTIREIILGMNYSKGLRGMAMAWGQGERSFQKQIKRRSSAQNSCSENIKR
ncbi:LexA family protein [Bacillus sp. FSL K6-6540]|uniref:LexA family protein n=1 Tax=Bacillus sp. FSL K6-6540 TaxID=2921512 RepID=UPI0030FCD067